MWDSSSEDEREATTHRGNGLVGAVVIGRVLSVSEGLPRVMVEADPSAPVREARSLVALEATDVGCEVALSFENGDQSKPIVLGRMVRPKPKAPQPIPNLRGAPVLAEVDGREERLEITGEREIVLRCGKASITLTRAGKIVLRGTYISSRSSGMNRIKGGSVQLN